MAGPLTWRLVEVPSVSGPELIVVTSAGLNLRFRPEARFDIILMLCPNCSPDEANRGTLMPSPVRANQLVPGCKTCGTPLPSGRAIHKMATAYPILEDWFMAHTNLGPLEAEVSLPLLFQVLKDFAEAQETGE